MGIRIATDQTWRHVKSGKQGLSKTRLILMQFHRPMMLKLVMVGLFRHNGNVLCLRCYRSQIFFRNLATLDLKILRVRLTKNNCS